MKKIVETILDNWLEFLVIKKSQLLSKKKKNDKLH